MYKFILQADVGGPEVRYAQALADVQRPHDGLPMGCIRQGVRGRRYIDHVDYLWDALG